MTFVIDTNCLIFMLGLSEAKKNSSIEKFLLHLEEEKRFADTLVAPKLIWYEFGQVLMKKTRFENLKSHQVNLAYEQFLKFSITTVDFTVGEYHEIFNLCGPLSYYDASYFFLAKKLSAQLVTNDRQLFTIAGDLAYQ